MPVNLSFKDEWIVGFVYLKGALGGLGDKGASYSKTRQSAKDSLSVQNVRVFTPNKFSHLEAALRTLARDGRLPAGDLNQLIEECRFWLSSMSKSRVELQFRRNHDKRKDPLTPPANAALKKIVLFDGAGGGIQLWNWEMPMSFRG